MTDSARAMLDALEGEWHGGGRAETPIAAPVDFSETIRFTRRNETALDYWQHAEDREGRQRHGEAGVWRVGTEGRLELAIAFGGTTEIAEGAVVGGSLATTSTSVGRAETSMNFQAARRRYRLDGDTLEYEVDLESAHFPMSFHLRAMLHRV